MSDDERVSSWEVVRQSLVRMRDDRKADPGEIREYVAIAALDALQALESQNQALQEALKEIRDLKPAPGETPTHQAAALWRSLVFVDMQSIARSALSPTQETDPE